MAVIVSISTLERTDVERSLLNEGQNHNYEKKRNTGNEQVQKYALDILLQIAIQNPTAASNLIRTETLLNCVQNHTKKVILLMSMIPSKHKELQFWLKNNQISDDKDESLNRLCNKFLSTI